MKSEKSKPRFLCEKSVFDLPETQALGGSRGTGQSTVLALERFGKGFRASVALPHFQQRTRQDPDHIIKKAVSREIELQFFSLSADLDSPEIPHRGTPGVFQRADSLIAAL